MSRQHIEIRQLFNAPVETIFNLLTDHESFGKVLATKIKRVVLQDTRELFIPSNPVTMVLNLLEE